jgi:hypothetical protein
MSSSPDPHQPRPEEWAAPDDAAIGSAFRRSLIALGILIALALAVLLWWWRPAPPPPVSVTPLSTPTVPPANTAQPPAVRFTDITAASGIQFVHHNGATGEKLLPETMGGGGAFLDFNNDGHPDLLFVNGAPWPWTQPPPSPTPTHALYRNDGHGRFTDVTPDSGLNVPFYGMGVACGDYDNDGWVDVLITGVQGHRLFHNLGNGRFQDVTQTAGLTSNPDGWSSSAAFLDFDRDGLLDLFVAHYVQWSRDIDFQVGYTLDGKNRAYGPPMNFQGTHSTLYRNTGHGTFADVSAPAGIQIRNSSTGVPAGKSLGVAPDDLNHDGWIDLVIANDTVQNFVFTNRHDGTFAEVGASLGVAFDPLGNARGAMGIDIAKYRHDDSLAIAIGNFANEMTALYVAPPGLDLFTDDAISEGIGPASRLLLKFGVFFFDYDLDGWPDLLTANGHLEEDIGRLQKSQQYRQPAQLFWNAGAHLDGGFIQVTPDHAGPDLFQPLVGRGSAYADIDGDGDLDVLLLQIAGPPVLLRNDLDLERHWIRFHLQGSRSPRDAIGAWIEVTSGGTTRSQQVMPTRSYLSQSELPVTFGLGTLNAVEKVRIRWPSGTVQDLGPLPTHTTHRVREP